MAIINDKENLARQESSGTAPRRSQDILGSLTTDGPIIPNLEPPVDAPPAYGENHDHLQFSRQGIEAGAVVTGMYSREFRSRKTLHIICACNCDHQYFGRYMMTSANSPTPQMMVELISTSIPRAED